MIDHIWFVLIGLAVTMITYVLWLRQQKQSKKAWLLKQIQSPNADKANLVAALERLNQQPLAKHKALLLILVMITPMALLLQQLYFDNQQAPALDPNQQSETPDLATAIRQLEAKLANNPDDIQGQLLYAQSMVAMKQYDKAAKAYEKANQLQPDDAALLTEWAEAIAFRDNTGSFLGQPSNLLKQAIEINPKHQKAMWLYGIVLYEQQQFESAELMWTELMTMVESPGVQSTLLKQINQARQALGKPSLSAVDINGNDNSSTGTTTAAPSNAQYSVTLTLDGDATSLPETATVFVFARSTDGMPMPIAAQKITAPFTWPITVTLNDTHSLQSNRLLSHFEVFNLSALISDSGAIEDKSWESETLTAQDNSNKTLILKRLQP